MVRGKVRRLLLLAGSALVLAGCTGGRAASPPTSSAPTSTTAVQGVVTGTATPCAGYAVTRATDAKIPVTVRVTKDGRTVARQTVTGAHTYRVALAPGSYALSSSGTQFTPPRTVIVAAGTVVRADLLSRCA